MFRKWLLTTLGIFGFLIIVVAGLGWLHCPLKTPAVEGYIVHSKLWNNHGIVVEIRSLVDDGKDALQRVSTKTNVNGYFSFYDLPKGSYNLVVESDGVGDALQRVST